MGFSIKAPKIKLPKIKAPKVKFEPSKLVTNAVKGVTNIQKEVVGSQVDAIGEILSKPGAAPLLGAAGAAFGIPGAGLLASSFLSNGTPEAPPGGSSPVVQYVSPDPAPSNGGSNKILYIAGAGGVVLILIMALIFRKKGK